MADSKVKNELIRKISGFQPETTGDLCDLCNKPLSEGENVFVEAKYSNMQWHLKSTYCDKHTVSLDSDENHIGTTAIVQCELGAKIQASFHPLYNPEIVSFNSE